MKLILIGAILLVTSFPFSMLSQDQDAILGKWYGEEMDQSYFEVTKNKNGTYHAIITESQEKSHIGKVVFTDLKYHPNSKTWKGNLTPPTRNISIDAELSKISEKKLKIEGKILFMKKTFQWERL